MTETTVQKRIASKKIMTREIAEKLALGYEKLAQDYEDAGWIETAMVYRHFAKQRRLTYTGGTFDVGKEQVK